MIEPNFLPPQIKLKLQKQSSADFKTRAFVSHGAPVWPRLSLGFPSALRLRLAAGERVFLGLIFLALIIVGMFVLPAADAAYRVYKLYPFVGSLKSDFANNDFGNVESDAAEAYHHLLRLNKDTAALARLDFVPGAGPRLEGLNHSVTGLQKAFKVFLPSFAVLGQIDGRVHDIPASERRQIIQNLADHSAELKSASDHLQKGSLPLAPHRIRQAAAVVSETASLAEDLPAILGVGQDARYLIIFANNLEIRPAGGFVGSYAILTMRDGEIADFSVRNSYELPGAFNLNLGPAAPAVVQRYLGIKGFPFRDSNWHPDYPASAATLLEAYRREGGEYGHEIKGVVTVTTEVLKEIMAMTGPVAVGDVFFNQENVIHELEKEVEISFLQKGLPWLRRKDIVGDLAVVLRQRVENFDFDQNSALLEKFGELADRRHIVFNFENPNLQRVAAARGWHGQMPAYAGDTLMVVDANLGAFKSEPAMTKNYAYHVTQQNGKLAGELTLDYAHRGQLNPLVTNYRTYLRVYVPAGSKLLSAAGAQNNVEVDSEFGRTVFGTLLTVPIAEARQITFRYELPPTVSAEPNYSLQILKQIGAYPVNLHLVFDFANVNKEIEDTLDTNKIISFD